jgi:O-methyltransferase
MEKAMNIAKAIRVARPYSKCSHERLTTFGRQLLRCDMERIDGDVAICGVWRGGLAILARLLSTRRIWLYDTFSGMAGRGEHDRKVRGGYVMAEGKAAVSADEVTEHLKATDTFRDIIFVQGKVEETLLVEANFPEKIAVLYLDTDWHESTKIELERLWPRLQKHGAMIVDDYGHWYGSQKAVKDFFPPVRRNMVIIDDSAIMMFKP